MKKKITARNLVGKKFISSMSDRQLKETVDALNRKSKKYVKFFGKDIAKVRQEYKRRRLGKIS